MASNNSVNPIGYAIPKTRAIEGKVFGDWRVQKLTQKNRLGRTMFEYQAHPLPSKLGTNTSGHAAIDLFRKTEKAEKAAIRAERWKGGPMKFLTETCAGLSEKLQNGIYIAVSKCVR